MASENLGKWNIIHWHIENFRSCAKRSGECISTAWYSFASLGDTKWMLDLYPRGDHFATSFVFILRRSQEGPPVTVIDFDLSIINVRGLPKFELLLTNQKFNKLSEIVRQKRVEAVVKRNLICSEPSFTILPEGILTIRCRLKSRNSEMLQDVVISHRTICREVLSHFNLQVKVKEKRRITVPFQSEMQPTPPPFVEVSYFENQEVSFVMTLKRLSGITFASCKIDLMIDDEPVQLALSEHVFEFRDLEEEWPILISFSIPWNSILEGSLNFECIFKFSDGDEYSIAENKPTLPISSMLHTCVPSPVGTAEYFLRCLYTVYDVCDLYLQAGNEIFPVHMPVLFKSAFFSHLFTSFHKLHKNTLIILDLDADTVRRVLVFLYTSTVEDLKFKSAKTLLYAADKYHLQSLRRNCMEFLRSRITPENTDEVLKFLKRHRCYSLLREMEVFICMHHTGETVSSCG